MKILVTGGLGFIGSHTVVELISAGFTPIIVDNLANSAMTRLNCLEKLTGRSISFEEVDCTNESEMRRVFSTYKINSVIHFAAFKSVEESQKMPEAYVRNNVGSTKVLLQLMEEFSVERFVFSSSCTVYGTPEINPVSESTPRLPAASVYGQTKQECEDLIFEVSLDTQLFNSIFSNEKSLIVFGCSLLSISFLLILRRLAKFV